MSIDSGLNETFLERLELAHRCKFGNCSHTSEVGCAVLEAIKNGELSKQRYQGYMKMKNEAAFNEMSYLDKKKKDKAMGKMIKSVMKGKKNKW